MKRIFALGAALLVSGLFANAASAQGQPPGMMQGMPQGGMPPGMMQGMPQGGMPQGMQGMPQGGMPQGQPPFQPSPFGWHPKFQSFVAAHGSDRCGKHNLLGKIFGKSHGGYVEGASSGTLVFPNHQFVRSPRDFFMNDQ